MKYLLQSSPPTDKYFSSKLPGQIYFFRVNGHLIHISLLTETVSQRAVKPKTINQSVVNVLSTYMYIHFMSTLPYKFGKEMQQTHEHIFLFQTNFVQNFAYLNKVCCLFQKFDTFSWFKQQFIQETKTVT